MKKDSISYDIEFYITIFRYISYIANHYCPYSSMVHLKCILSWYSIQKSFLLHSLNLLDWFYHIICSVYNYSNAQMWWHNIVLYSLTSNIISIVTWCSESEQACLKSTVRSPSSTWKTQSTLIFTLLKCVFFFYYGGGINWWRQSLYTSRSYKDLRWFS